jgi:hypothetical protein
MKRWFITFLRPRRELISGKLFPSPRVITTYACSANQAVAQARARLPWADCQSPVGGVE